MNQAHEEPYCNILVGHQLILIEKKDYTWFFKFADEIIITTDGYWRLITESRIAISSEDQAQSFGHAQPVDAAVKVQLITKTKVVESASIDSKTGDLKIFFNGGVEIQFLQLSSGFESWNLIANGTETIFNSLTDLENLRALNNSQI